MDGEGISFYCHTYIEDEQSAMSIVTMMAIMMNICFMKFLRATRMWELKHRITKVHNCHHDDDVEVLPRSGGSVGRGLGVDVWMDPWRCSTILKSAPNCHHDDDADSLSWLEVGGATSKASCIIDFKYFIYSIYYISTYILYIIKMLTPSHG